MTTDAIAPPRLTLVVSMYNVERYLGEFLASVAEQQIDPSTVELVFIDDGSPDASAHIARDWLRQHRFPGRVLRQPNQGLSSARNHGLEEASGEWISFPDPDDVLGRNYLPLVLERLARLPARASALATNIIYLDERSGEQRDTHPLRSLFSSGPRLIDMSADPQAVKLQAASTFFRRGAILENGLRFDARIRPNFEDGAFMMRYQASMTDPLLAVAPHAHYLYRRRADDTSLVASSWTKVEKYVDLPEFGWLETLKAIADLHGSVPRWAQTTVLYDMHWYFRYDSRIHTPTRSMPVDVQKVFMRLCREVLAYIEPATIMGYSLTTVPLHTRLAWLAMSGRLPLPESLDNWRVDPFHDLVQLKYHFAGDRPAEEFLLDGASILPVFAKDRSVDYFGETVMHERILWLPNTAQFNERVRAYLDGEPVPIRDYERFLPEWPAVNESASLALDPLSRRIGARATDLRTAVGRRAKGARARVTSLARGDAAMIRRPLAKMSVFQASHGKWHRRFRDAWVFMDRDTQAQDNAEHLYRWVHAHRPAVNAWFVLRRSSPDWTRLETEGFRLVEFGTHQHTLLLKNAAHLVSSHVDHYVVHPLSRSRYGPENWSYTFLQHGVTKDDISRWLNGKPIELLVAAASAELAAFVDDDTPYVVTAKQAKLTGFPRHDALLAKSRAAREKDLILVMPTWREYLMSAVSGKGNDRDLVEDFEESEYVRSWSAFLSDPHLREYATTHGLRLAFVPHPNLEHHVSEFRLPGGVEVVTYGSTDVQEVIARARVLVTDYSSLAFDAAYLLTPVVYFQFDREKFFSLHPHRPGYFDYERDGFGPIATDASSASAAVRSLLDQPSEQPHDYAGRAEAFFTDRDGLNCQRTYEAIRQIRTHAFSAPDQTIAIERMEELQ
ncbi:bifunctional glycosyltransferase/CDP-glycerol:glycerophosphate glycerophosphotransferase [Microbacterium sp.]|uniref:bifunctional glycosyltransferase/CDP-glycerol:glycerophosphate glycerophosphotransferase n=1 Tax=Microbacterium sp. TaxID=51671 RepID=UPI003A92B627